MLVWGSVRWFNIAKGYGFVDADDGAGDILLNKRELLAFGAFTAPEGARILVRVEVTARGRHATEVLELLAPAAKDPPANAGPLVPARVRWFDRARGYGFVNVFGRREDVYLHMSTLREFGLGAVVEGEAIVVRVAEGPNGLTACEVRDWDYVNRPRGRRRASGRPIAVPTGRNGRASSDHRQAGATMLEVLRADARGGRRGGPRAAPRVRIALRDCEIEVFDPGCHEPWTRSSGRGPARRPDWREEGRDW